MVFWSVHFVLYQENNNHSCPTTRCKNDRSCKREETMDENSSAVDLNNNYRIWKLKIRSFSTKDGQIMQYYEYYLTALQSLLKCWWAGYGIILMDNLFKSELFLPVQKHELGQPFCRVASHSFVKMEAAQAMIYWMSKNLKFMFSKHY